MLHDSIVVLVAVLRRCPRAVPLATITMRNSAHGFPFVSHIWDAYGAPLGGPSGRWSSALKLTCHWNFQRGGGGGVRENPFYRGQVWIFSGITQWQKMVLKMACLQKFADSRPTVDWEVDQVSIMPCQLSIKEICQSTLSQLKMPKYTWSFLTTVAKWSLCIPGWTLRAESPLIFLDKSRRGRIFLICQQL